MSVTIPKFGKDTDLILQGISKILMTFSNFEFLNLQPVLEAFDQSLQSTYLQTKLVEQKIRYFTNFTKALYDYGSPEAQKFAYKMFVPRVGTLLTRFMD